MEQAVNEEKIEAKPQVDENVDKLLNSVSDEYLAKKKRIRIISYSIISFVAFALAVIIIVMSCVKVDLKPKFITAGTTYRVTINNKEAMFIDQNSSEYKKFTDKFLNSFKLNYLTALFTGKLGNYDIQEDPPSRENNFYSDTQNSQGMSSKLQSYLGSNYVKISYDQPKQILNSDGSVYHSEVNTETTLVFNDLYFALNTENSEQDLVFYLGAFGYLSKGEAKIVKIKVRANTYNLYKYITE